jgi:hypothetical protein
VKKFMVIVAVLAFSASASAAGIESRAYTCSGLQSLIAAKGFVYIGIPFQGFAVSGANFCAGDERLESRSVATSDSPACTVPYCETRPGQENR